MGAKLKAVDKMIAKMISKKLEPSAIAEWKKPLNEAKVALITTGGVHLHDQVAFDGEKGDPTYRVLPADMDFEDWTITHGHYDQTEAEKDLDVILPIKRLEELIADGHVGSMTEVHYSFMGYIPDIGPLVDKYAKDLADDLVDRDVDIAILSPT